VHGIPRVTLAKTLQRKMKNQIMNLFENIKYDHEVQRSLLDKLVDTQGNSQEREKIYDELKNHLKTHADAEERYFYRPLFKHDATQDQARHSVAEHEEIDEILNTLDETAMDNPAWLHAAKELRHKVIHHLDEEEHDVFPMARKAINEDERSTLSESYREMMTAEL
jgi:hemerythrin superfamily protein